MGSAGPLDHLMLDTNLGVLLNGNIYNKNGSNYDQLSRVMRKTVFAYAKTKVQICLCFHYIDSTIPLLSKSSLAVGGA